MKLSKTKVSRILGSGKATLTHGQSVRQSIGYQSAELNYQVAITVPDSQEGIKKGAKRVEHLVEQCLVEKLGEQRELLLKLAKMNRGS